MTWQATAYVLKLAQEQRELTPLQVLLCYAIAGRYSREHHCAFGQARAMMGDTHLSQSKLYELLAEVEDMDIVSVWTGPLPRRRDGAPRDGRTDKGLMYCFVALDPDGPDVEGVQRRPRQGGRPKIGSPLENQISGDRFSGNGQIGSPVEGDRFSGKEEIGSPVQTRLNNRLLKPAVVQPDRQELLINQSKERVVRVDDARQPVPCCEFAALGAPYHSLRCPSEGTPEPSEVSAG